MAARTRASNLDLQTVLDGMEPAVLVFAPDGALLIDNLAARHLLGHNLAHIRARGWEFCAGMLNAGRNPGEPGIETIRADTLKSTRPAHFNTRLEGVFIAGSVAAIYAENGQVLTQLTLQPPDWTPLTRLMDNFRAETRAVVSATRGHADLITRLLKNRPQGVTADALAGQVSGFTAIIASHMYRLEALMDLLYRVEAVVTGQLAADVGRLTRPVRLDTWIEDFLDDVLEETLVDPESGRVYDHERFALNIPPGLDVAASPSHLRNVLRDLLGNAVLYSESNAPILVQAARTADKCCVRIDVIDRGCGVRAKESARVFAPFERARQPQVLSQFGYGLSLYLAKAEVEAMGGRIWFESEEGMGATFSVKLPIWNPDRAQRNETDGEP